MDLMSIFEPEEVVGNLWHDMARNFGEAALHEGAAVRLGDVQRSCAILFRALGGGAGVDIGEAATEVVRHRRGLRRQLGHGSERQALASFDGERLRLPAEIAFFDQTVLNRAAYLWLVAMAALSHEDFPETILQDKNALADLHQIEWNARAARLVLENCPGLAALYPDMRDQSLKARPKNQLSGFEARIEDALRLALSDPFSVPEMQALQLSGAVARGYHPFAPVPIWLTFLPLDLGKGRESMQEETAAPPATAGLSKRKLGERRDLEQADRRDSFIIHRFESILSWVESMNINRSIDDDDDENAAKAADDQDKITLTKNQKKAATRLRLHLDLSPAEADHERLSDKFTYPEWNTRTHSYMQDHCRVLEAEAEPNDQLSISRRDKKRAEEVRRQFEALLPRRILRPRQLDGAELDIDAVIASRADLRATGHASDRIYQASRQTERDFSVGFLIDTSRSTEASLNDTTALKVAQSALASLATGVHAAGDRCGIWGFSSLRRDRVFMTCCKSFDTPMSPDVISKIHGLKPGHYTRLGAAIRHATTKVVDQPSARRMLLVLTDGKPNDLDHYEGQHGIEDTRMAVREARQAGLIVHGVIIDEDGQDWFARIFGRGGFTLVPRPERLGAALPEIYQTLTQE